MNRNEQQTGTGPPLNKDKAVSLIKFIAAERILNPDNDKAANEALVNKITAKFRNENWTVKEMDAAVSQVLGDNAEEIIPKLVILVATEKKLREIYANDIEVATADCWYEKTSLSLKIARDPDFQSLCIDAAFPVPDRMKLALASTLCLLETRGLLEIRAAASQGASYKSAGALLDKKPEQVLALLAEHSSADLDESKKWEIARALYIATQRFHNLHDTESHSSSRSAASHSADTGYTYAMATAAAIIVADSSMIAIFKSVSEEFAQLGLQSRNEANENRSEDEQSLDATTKLGEKINASRESCLNYISNLKAENTKDKDNITEYKKKIAAKKRGLVVLQLVAGNNAAKIKSTEKEISTLNAQIQELQTSSTAYEQQNAVTDQKIENITKELKENPPNFKTITENLTADNPFENILLFAKVMAAPALADSERVQLGLMVYAGLFKQLDEKEITSQEGVMILITTLRRASQVGEIFSDIILDKVSDLDSLKKVAEYEVANELTHPDKHGCLKLAKHLIDSGTVSEQQAVNMAHAISIEGTVASNNPYFKKFIEVSQKLEVDFKESSSVLAVAEFDADVLALPQVQRSAESNYQVNKLLHVALVEYVKSMGNIDSGRKVSRNTVPKGKSPYETNMNMQISEIVFELYDISGAEFPSQRVFEAILDEVRVTVEKSDDDITRHNRRRTVHANYWVKRGLGTEMHNEVERYINFREVLLSEWDRVRMDVSELDMKKIAPGANIWSGVKGDNPFREFQYNKDHMSVYLSKPPKSAGGIVKEIDGKLYNKHRIDDLYDAVNQVEIPAIKQAFLSYLGTQDLSYIKAVFKLYPEEVASFNVVSKVISYQIHLLEIDYDGNTKKEWAARITTARQLIQFASTTRMNASTFKEALSSLKYIQFRVAEADKKIIAKRSMLSEIINQGGGAADFLLSLNESVRVFNKQLHEPLLKMLKSGKLSETEKLNVILLLVRLLKDNDSQGLLISFGAEATDRILTDHGEYIQSDDWLVIKPSVSRAIREGYKPLELAHLGHIPSIIQCFVNKEYPGQLLREYPAIISSKETSYTMQVSKKSDYSPSDPWFEEFLQNYDSKNSEHKIDDALLKEIARQVTSTISESDSIKLIHKINDIKLFRLIATEIFYKYSTILNETQDVVVKIPDTFKTKFPLEIGCLNFDKNYADKSAEPTASFVQDEYLNNLAVPDNPKEREELTRYICASTDNIAVNKLNKHSWIRLIENLAKFPECQEIIKGFCSPENKCLHIKNNEISNRTEWEKVQRTIIMLGLELGNKEMIIEFKARYKKFIETPTLDQANQELYIKAAVFVPVEFKDSDSDYILLELEESISVFYKVELLTVANMRDRYFELYLSQIPIGAEDESFKKIVRCIFNAVFKTFGKAHEFEEDSERGSSRPGPFLQSNLKRRLYSLMENNQKYFSRFVGLPDIVEADSNLQSVLRQILNNNPESAKWCQDKLIELLPSYESNKPLIADLTAAWLGSEPTKIYLGLHNNTHVNSGMRFLPDSAVRDTVVALLEVNDPSLRAMVLKALGS